MELNTNTFNRLSLGIIEKERCSPEDAMNKLGALTLNLICGEEICSSLSLQAALLTAVNTAKRAFMGGVFVKMPSNTGCLLNWPGKKTLSDIIIELGGRIVEEISTNNFSLTFGSKDDSNENQMRVVCNDWQAGVLVDGESSSIEANTSTIPTAGVFAGSLGVFLAFLKMSGILLSACDRSAGISLWRPDLYWLDEQARGPKVSILPKKYWILGLGHLGQAYLWNIGLLPYKTPGEVSLLLQDDDFIAEANWSAGLLTEITDRNLHKTRLCVRWLEKREFKTTITERRFDENTIRAGEEPFAALCGFDSAKSRLFLENAGFDLIVEAGLGDDLHTFDKISFHTFPNASQTPQDIWAAEELSGTNINHVVHEVLKTIDKNACGILPISIAGKSVSASFVGACAGALGIAELLRGLHEGMRYDKISLQLRELEDKKAFPTKGLYSSELGRNGFINM